MKVRITVEIEVANLSKLERGANECYRPKVGDDATACAKDFLFSRMHAGLQHVDGVDAVRRVE